MGLEFVPLLGIRVQGSLYYTDRTALITHNPDGTLGNNGRGSLVATRLNTENNHKVKQPTVGASISAEPIAASGDYPGEATS